MEIDLVFAWILVALMVVVGLVQFVYSRSDAGQEKELFKLWQRSGLDVNGRLNQMAPDLKRGLARRQGASWLGGSAGAFIAGIGLCFVQPHHALGYAVFVVIPAVALGSIGAEVLATLRHTLFHAGDNSKRIARVGSVRFTDYVNPLLLWVTPFLLLVTVALGVSAIVVSKNRRLSIGVADGMATLAGVAIVILVSALCYGVGRKVLDQPQPATDAAQLMWDDAIRATLLLKMFQWTAMAASVVLSLGVQGLIRTIGAVNGASVSGSPEPYLYPFYIFPLIVFGTHWATGYFRNKLWANRSVAAQTPSDSAHA